MERLTTELTLPSGAKVIMYDFLVNGDYKAMELELSKLMVPDFSGIDKSLPEEEQQKLRDEAVEKKGNEIRTYTFLKQRQLVTRMLIKSAINVDGSTANDIDAFIYNLSKTDADVIDKRVEEIDDASVMTDQEKKN